MSDTEKKQIIEGVEKALENGNGEKLTKKIRKVGKYTSIITYLVLFLTFFVNMFLYMISGAEHFKDAIGVLITFLDHYQWWWITLSSFVGLTGLVKSIKGAPDSALDLLKSFMGKGSNSSIPPNINSDELNRTNPV